MNQNRSFKAHERVVNCSKFCIAENIIFMIFRLDVDNVQSLKFVIFDKSVVQVSIVQGQLVFTKQTNHVANSQALHFANPIIYKSFRNRLCFAKSTSGATRSRNATPM